MPAGANDALSVLRHLRAAVPPTAFVLQAAGDLTDSVQSYNRPCIHPSIHRRQTLRYICQAVQSSCLHEIPTSTPLPQPHADTCIPQLAGCWARASFPHAYRKHHPTTKTRAACAACHRPRYPHAGPPLSIQTLTPYIHVWRCVCVWVP